MNISRSVRAAGVLVAAAATVLGVQSAASAATGSATVFVSQGAGSGACLTPDATTIQQGVAMAAAGGTVVVCPGTYPESVTITTPGLTLRGQPGAVVDATGQSYGIGIGANRVTVTGMTVHNAAKNLVAPADAQATCGAPASPLCAGIVTFVAGVPGNQLVITNNVLTENIGFGLDVVSTFNSLIRGNDASNNGVVGINVVDDLGIPVRSNQLIGNVASNNASGCGIALASHTGAGVISNVVLNNRANDNGLAAGGAGILLATPVPNGVVRLNQIVSNAVNGNGHSGIQVHFHPATATVDGNSIVDNQVGTNNVLGDDSAADPDTTGILIGSNSPLNIIVRGNVISRDVVGIFQAGPAITLRAQGNVFRNVQIPIKVSPVFF